MSDLGTLKEVVELTLISGYVEDEQPGSLLITAEVEEGKTHLVSRYAQLPSVAYLSDATAFGIFQSYQDALVAGSLKHLIFPELVRPLSRQKDTAASFVAFLAELMEEGIKEIRTFATDFQLPRPVKAGVIACIARGSLKCRLPHWNQTGFLSRLLVISYRYGSDTEREITEAIIRGDRGTPSGLKLSAPAKVELPIEIGRQIANLAKPLAQALYPPLHGFRMQKHLQRLAKASALRDGRHTVESADFERLVEITQLANLNYNAV